MTRLTSANRIVPSGLRARPSAPTQVRALAGTALMVGTLAAACWALTLSRMNAMGMGLGSLSFFAATWTMMMAAMMLPSALPALAARPGYARRAVTALASALLFAAIYVGIWALFGLGAYGTLRGIRASGLLAWGGGAHYLVASALLAAAIYELTPFKGACLARCKRPLQTPQNVVSAALRYSVDCVGCSAGLMVALFAVGVMSVTWMVVITLVLFVEKVPSFGPRLLPAIAACTAGLGIWVAVDPSAVPGLTVLTSRAGCLTQCDQMPLLEAAGVTHELGAIAELLTTQGGNGND